MKIELSDNARKWQAIAREYADEYLQPHEIEAELNDGVLPDDITKRNKQRAIELGFSAIDVPKAHGGLELSMEEQAAIWEQLGRVTNALSWCFSEPQSWMFEACSEEQVEQYILPMMRGEKKDCYAITESGPGSDVAGIEATATKDGGDYVLTVEDDGRGIPEHEREKVFKAFTRIDDSRNRETGGYGLGLAVVARVAELHGGAAAVDASSTLGGASFSIRWPARITAA